MPKTRTTLLVSEIHPVNLLMFWVVSFFVNVEVWRISRMCPRSLTRRIRLTDLSDYISWSGVQSFKSNAMGVWENQSNKIPSKDWIVEYQGLSLNFAIKAQQDLGPYFERLLLIQDSISRKAHDSKTYVVECPQFRYLKTSNLFTGVLDYPIIPVISQINLLFDYLYDYLYTMAQLARTLLSMLSAIFPIRNRLRPSIKNALIIWDAVDPHEITLSADSRSFSWIIDNKRIFPQDVLFILPRGSDRLYRPDLLNSDYLAYTIPEIYRLIPLKFLFASIANLMLFMARYLLPGRKNFNSSRKASYFDGIFTLQPITKYIQPTSYVSNISRIGQENPVVIYLNENKIDTVMYSYSANSHSISGDEKACDLRQLKFANILASHVIVWHKQYEEYIHRHPQENAKAYILGPLMDGDETVCQSHQVALRTAFGLSQASGPNVTKFISFFDIPPVSQQDSINFGIEPRPYSEEYGIAFLRDMLRLLEDFDELSLIFKPKRALTKANYSYSSEFRDLLIKLGDSDRSLLIDEGVNPWVPIAVADLCVAMPFTSPPMAAMHYGIPGLFHDPTGIAVQHGYHSMSTAITHDYVQLRAKVQSLVFGNTEIGRKQEVVWTIARGFIGDRPGTNSSERFRNFLTGTYK